MNPQLQKILNEPCGTLYTADQIREAFEAGRGAGIDESYDFVYASMPIGDVTAWDCITAFKNILNDLQNLIDTPPQK